MKEIGLATPSFEGLIKGNYVYVDKTAYVFKMVRGEFANNFYFISRPRRFGKSLMCSTLEALFLGKRELFKGLYIEDKTDYGFKTYPVLRFDFSSFGGTSYNNFIAKFTYQISLNAERCGIDLHSEQPSLMIAKLLDSLEDRAVIIIDEFDSPFVDAISAENAELVKQMRLVFTEFYKEIKLHSSKVRFFFMTGCTKLAGLNIFSAMNNLKDISRHPDYAGMFGYTEEELLSNFSGYIDAKFSAADGKYESRDDFLAALRGYYDGYRFSPESESRVYNPVSIGNYFSDPMVDFSNYWMDTGGMSTLAITLAKKQNLITLANEPVGMDADNLDGFDISLLADDALVGKDAENLAIGVLYYSGYLTVVGGRTPGLLLGFPNTEVSRTFTKRLVMSYSRNPRLLENSILKVQGAAEAGDWKTVINVLNEHYKTFTYQDFRKFKEQLVQIVFKSFFEMLGMNVKTEVDAGLGRADAILETVSCNYIFEFKIDSESSADAIKQIVEKKYAWLFADDKKPLHLVGIDFSSKKRQIVNCSHLIYGAAEAEEFVPEEK